jgi:putative transposase
MSNLRQLRDWTRNRCATQNRGDVGGTLLTWAEQQGIRIEHIQPGKPQQNAYVERYNRTVRYAWLARTLFDSVEQVQNMATR